MAFSSNVIRPVGMKVTHDGIVLIYSIFLEQRLLEMFLSYACIYEKLGFTVGHKISDEGWDEANRTLTLQFIHFRESVPGGCKSLGLGNFHG